MEKMHLDMNEEGVPPTALREKPTHSSPPQPQSSSSLSSFSATFDRSNHIAFLERVFEFFSEHNNFLETESAEKVIVSLLQAVEEKWEFLKVEIEKAEKKQRKDLKASEEKGKSDNMLKEEKEPKAKDTNKDESASRGTPKKAYLLLSLILVPC
ncbi:hypothetical protein JHK87_010452 [Glycine soja]|nr:hypothetical protein JHK87_010452 [Glycine soja]